ncbi:MAG: TatD family hydrolase [Acidimicrobiia bacterium]|nr:TatD family hydrolase [Acidimicrobiia bacterium]
MTARGGDGHAGHRPPEAAWVDSHCHLQWLSGGPDAALDRARSVGVTGFVCVGTDLASSREAVELARRHPDVRATVGLHPHDASRLAGEWEGIEALAPAPEVTAVGETGFDLHYRHSEPAEQEEAFRAHIRLARRLDRTLVVHSREAWDDTFRVLADEGPPDRTVLHCFTGGPGEARRALDLGACLSFSGILSFRAADDLRAAAALTPPDRVLVETDAPYLAPVPYRGRENEPALLPFVGAALARATGRAEVEVAAATSGLARGLFRLPAPGTRGGV